MFGADDEDPAVVGGAVERGRPEGNKDTRLDERRESVACAGCVDADVGVEAPGGGEDEDGGRDVVELVGEDREGGEALPLRRGGSGSRDREGLVGATLTLPLRSTRTNFGWVISEASASASASSVDMSTGTGIGIGTGRGEAVEDGAGSGSRAAVNWVSRKYMGSS